MTFKKSMISIAAASVIAAGITGCGSSSSGGTTGTSTSGVATSITASKGYIQDANVTGYDANGTALYSYAYTAGSNGVYTVTDGEDNLTSAPLSEVDYIKISPKGALTVLHMLDDAGEDANITNGSFTVPAKGTTVINSITALAYQMAAANTADYNLSSEANITALISKIEAALGVSGAATTDPKNNALMNDVNRLLGAVTPAKAAALGTALIAKSAPADLNAVIANISSAAQTAGDTTLKSFVDMAKNYVTSGSLATLNIEKAMASVLNGTTLSTDMFQPISATSALRIVKDSLVVNGSTDVDGLPGHKLDNTGAVTVAFKMTAATADANLTGAEATFFANFTAKKNDDSANYTKNTAISMELEDMNVTNYSDGKVKFTVNDTNLSKVMVTVNSTTSEGISYKDSWSLTDLGVTDATTMIETVTGLTTFKVEALYAKVFAAVDANHTTSNSAVAYAELGSTLAINLNDVTIGAKIVDVNGSAMSVLTYDVPTEATYSTTSATVGASSGVSLFKQTSVDFRTTTNAANNAPSLNAGADFIHADLDGGEEVSDTTAGTVHGVTNVQVWNYDNTANANVISELKLDWDTESDSENNATVSVSMASTIDGNSSVSSIDFLSVEFNATKLADNTLLNTLPDHADNQIEFTVDANGSTGFTFPTNKHAMATYTFTPTDEFGKVGNETNLTIALNRAPSAFTISDFNVTLNNATAASATDINGSYMTNNTADANSSAIAAKNSATILGNLTNVFTDPDGDTNYALSITDAVCTSTVNTIAGNALSVAITHATKGLSIAIVNGVNDANLTATVLGDGSELNSDSCELEITATDDYGLATEHNITIKVQ